VANIYKNAKLDLTTTNETVLYTVPSDSRAIVKSIMVCDDSNNGSTLTVTITDASSNVFVLFDVKAIAGHATVEFLTHPVILEENEILKVTAADANRLHVISSILEINRD
jgi:hypothetical protein